MEAIPCPLCSGNSKTFYEHKQRVFLHCQSCSSVFLHPKNYISPTKEQAHYECHENNPDDAGYQKFVSPIVNNILQDFAAADKGLDFGSGTGSPIVKMLGDKGYNISQYDLFFHNNPATLKEQYNYIACSEVAEHFKEPYKEFCLLRDMLLPGGKLYMMTELFDESRDFGQWYYKNDPTHVFLYHKNAFEWIRQEYGFKTVIVEKRLIILSL